MNEEKVGGLCDPDRYMWVERNLDGTITYWVKKPAYQELRCGVVLALISGFCGFIFGVCL